MGDNRTIRDVYGEDVTEIVQVKTKNSDALFSVREPTKGLKIIKTEYEIYKDDATQQDSSKKNK
jgi:hypothetical protein